METQYTTAERWMDGIVHVVGVSLALVAIVVLLSLVIPTGNSLLVVAASIYALGLMATFGFSAAYNISMSPRWKDLLRRFDHAAIYLMIAGTYTPLAMISVGGVVGYALLSVVWTIALIGLVLKLSWPDRFERLSLVLYLALGWLGLAAAGSIIAALPVAALVLLLIGGLMYTTGVIFHLWTRLSFHKAIWHGFVLTAAVCHYAAVLESILP
ncbi:PAQR family membrane homeostasis protein TrhA [Pararhodospirillum photometricum]|uniref:Hly-III related proteins n=1 Tax=Pararhodospirillum photometricum DSM 122 TaxID=1150469 RepID=H6SKY8_PARPM|nr:hemolysin III family protein [Pararhodospirillum photometricum]CCG08653.1 Hly-III related proteins [Pararhodospirillum photometricum DSM 122]